MTAAAAGDTIYVCAGTYPEAVSIDKNLTLDGAQFGVDARTGTDQPGRRDRSSTRRVAAGLQRLHLRERPATTGTIDGFTISA